MLGLLGRLYGGPLSHALHPLGDEEKHQETAKPSAPPQSPTAQDREDLRSPLSLQGRNRKAALTTELGDKEK